MTPESTATLLSLPTVLWAGVLAAFVSLAGAVGGVVLSNSSSERRLRNQLRHDAAEKQRDRIASLRRDVYLQLFEELSAVSGHLGSLAGKDPVAENLAGPLQQAMSQLGKVQLVGDQQTAILAGELASQIGESLFRLIAAAQPLHTLKIDIEIAEKNFHECMREAQRVNNEMRALNESGKSDPAKFRALQTSFDFARQQYECAGGERDAGWKQFNGLQPSFLAAASAELKLIAPAQAKLMAAMRGEIGLTADLEFMLDRIERNHERMRAATNKLLVDITQAKT